MDERNLNRRPLLGAAAAGGMTLLGEGAVEPLVAFTPMPEHIAAARNNDLHTPICVPEIAHRRGAQQRNIRGI